MEHSRRAILAASAGVAMLAGCTTEQSDPQEDNNTMTDRTPRHFDDDGNLTSPVDNGSVSTGELDTDVSTSEVYAVAGERTLLEALRAVPQGSNGEFSGPLMLKEVVAVPSDGGPSFGNIDFDDINSGTTNDKPSGVTIRGTSMQASTPIIGSGDHTLTMSTNDAYVECLSVRQEDDTGDYDAIHISEREAKVRDIGSDGAPRNSIRVAAPQAQLRDLELSDSGSYALDIEGSMVQVSDVQIKPPACNSGILLNDNRAQVTNAAVEDVSNIAIRIAGNNNSVSNAIVQEPGTVGLEVATGVTIANVDATIYGAGTDGAVIAGDYGQYDLVIYQSTNDDLVVSGSNNTITVTCDGSVTLSDGSSDNTVTGTCGSVTDNGSGNDTSGLN